MINLAILGSGRGSNCRVLLEAIRNGTIRATPRLVISDVIGAPILDIAREFDVPVACVLSEKFKTRYESEVEMRLVKMLRDQDVELIALAGFMRVLKEPALDAFPRRIVNIHPSLLPRFPGLEAWKQALAAGEKVTGCTVHYVDKEIDHGDIIAQREVPVLPGDTAESLHGRIQTAEHALYPETVAALCRTIAATD